MKFKPAKVSGTCPSFPKWLHTHGEHIDKCGGTIWVPVVAPVATPNAQPTAQSARQWLIAGGGGHEDGEDGIRACTLSMEAAIELMDEFAEYRESELRSLIGELAFVLRLARLSTHRSRKTHFTEDIEGCPKPSCKSTCALLARAEKEQR